MASLKALTLTFTLIYFVTFSSARISVPLNNVHHITTNHVPRSASKKSILVHKPFDQVLFLDTQPDFIGMDLPTNSNNNMHILPDPTTSELKESKNDDHISLDPTIFELAKVKNHEPTNDDHTSLEPTNFEPANDEHRSLEPTNFEPTNDEHRSSDPTTVELENETTNRMTQSKNNKHDHFPIKEHHETDKELSVVSENTVSIETLHLNPSKYVIRPINRHFRIRRCRQHMKQDHQNQHQIPYGNNMIMGKDDIILAGQTIERFDPSVLHISTHSAPAKRPRIHHYHHHHDGDDNTLRHPFRQYTDQQKLKKQVEEERDAFRQWLAKQKLKKQVEEEIQKRKARDARKGGFMKSFRKFLNHF